MAAHSNLGTVNSWMTETQGVLFYPALSDVHVCKAQIIFVRISDDSSTGMNRDKSRGFTHKQSEISYWTVTGSFLIIKATL